MIRKTREKTRNDKKHKREEERRIKEHKRMKEESKNRDLPKLEMIAKYQ